MQVQIDFWQIVLLLVSFLGACAAAGKFLLVQMQRHLDDLFRSQEAARLTSHQQLSGRLDAIEQANRDESLQWSRVERELLHLKAELPLHYVRREDYIRGQTVIEAKIDSVIAKVDTMRFRAIVNEGNHP